MTEKENLTIGYYDSNAKAFANSSINAKMDAICDEFLSFLEPNSRILDLGCGSGRDSRYFIERGYTVLPVDGSTEMCAIATEVTGVHAQKMLFNEINFKQEFDGVWACASLLHAEREQLPEILHMVWEALKYDGIFYMSFKYGVGSREYNGRFFSDMTENDVPFLCKEFEIEEVFVTEDVREDHAGECWLNIFARKNI